MTEAEWFRCTDAEAMLAYLEDKVSARKFRLYKCAMLRLVWSSLEAYERQAIETTERHFDTPSGSRRPAAKRRANKYTTEEAMGHLVEKLYLFVSDQSPECLVFLRCIFGNPFRSISLDSAWLSWHNGLLVSIAQQIYDSRDFSDLPILADALEDAGCYDDDLLRHCRQEEEHVRGCFVVDLCLGLN